MSKQFKIYGRAATEYSNQMLLVGESFDAVTGEVFWPLFLKRAQASLLFQNQGIPPSSDHSAEARLRLH